MPVSRQLAGLRNRKPRRLSATNVCGAHLHRALLPRDEALAGSPVSTLSRAQDGPRIPKSCVRLWKTPTHEGPDHRTTVLLDREERVPTRCGESRLGQLLDTAALWPRRLRS